MTATAVPDTVFEGGETVVIDITGVTNGTEAGTQQATTTITDDEVRFLWQNLLWPADVTGEGDLTAADALAIINYINGHGGNTSVPPAAVPPPYLDVDGDALITANDVLVVVNELNKGATSPRGNSGLAGGESSDSALAERDAPEVGGRTRLPPSTWESLNAPPTRAAAAKIKPGEETPQGRVPRRSWMQRFERGGCVVRGTGGDAGKNSQKPVTGSTTSSIGRQNGIGSSSAHASPSRYVTCPCSSISTTPRTINSFNTPFGSMPAWFWKNERMFFSNV